MWPQGREGAAGTGGGVGATASPDRYQGLEQRLEAELQAAATSKEEALRELKTRALQLEEELVQVRRAERWQPRPTPLSILPEHIQGCARSGPSSPMLVLPLEFWPVFRLVPHLGASWRVPRAWGSGGPCPGSGVFRGPGALFPSFVWRTYPSGSAWRCRLCFSRASPLPSELSYGPFSWLAIVSEAPSSGLSSGVWGGPRTGKDTGHHNTGCQGTAGPQQSPWWVHVAWLGGKWR